MNENEEEKSRREDEDQEAHESAANRINDIENKGRDLNRIKNAAKGIRTGANAAEGVGAAAEGLEAAGAVGGGAAAAAGEGAVSTGLAASSPAWGTAAAIIILIILLIMVVYVLIFVGGSSSPANSCTDISATSDTASTGSPVTITLDGCSPNVTFSWITPALGGNLTPLNGQSATYTPPAVSANTTVTIVVNVCSPTDPAKCTQNSIDITIKPSTCDSLGGSCTSSSLCSAEGKPIPGATDCAVTGRICCNFNNAFKFYCQYGAVNSIGRLIDPRSWNTPSCDIVIGGCGPTSIVMITNTFGKNYTPAQVATQNNNNGCSGSNGVSASDVINYFAPWLRNRGFAVTGNLASGGNVPLATLKNYISNGYYILGGANVRWIINSGFTRGFAGHAFVISGVNTGNSSLTVYDPTFCEANHYGGLRTLTNVNNYGSTTTSVRGWLFAFAIKLK